MRKILIKVLPILLFITVFLYSPTRILATPLSWNLVYPSIDESTTIKIDQSNNQTVYASVRKHPKGFELLKSQNFGLTWESTKANLYSGSDVNWLSIHSGDNSKIAISLWDAGVYLSDDSGSNWQLIFPSLTPRSVEISPSNVNTIFVGIGGNHDSNSGVYKTTNKGLNWTKLNPLTNNNAEIVIDKNNHNRIFADSDPYFYRSLDEGMSWTKLPLTKAYAISVIDNQNTNVIYSAQFDSNIGVYKSMDNGGSWHLKSEGINSPYFRLAQDGNGALYASRVSFGGGLWRSTDGAEHWENVGDPAWGSANTWGLDAKGGRVIVSVEGLGIFVANADGTPINPPPTTPNPVVFVPGMTASWSHKGLVENQPTTYLDWQLVPGSGHFYGPIFDTLSSAGLVKDQTMFTFAYDWTSQISQNAASLNEFLQSEVLPKNGGQKANIISHSMGGLIATYCFEKISGCSDKINKIVTAGSPFQGAVDVYPLWEGGKIEESSALKQILFKVLLNQRASPEFATDVSLIRAKAKGVGDLMPIFDYVNGKTYAFMSTVGHNPTLESISNPSSILKNSLTAIYGDSQQTTKTINTTIPDRWEQLNGLWPDGKPVSKTFGSGDNSVLDFSANLSGALGSQSYSGIHTEYFRDTAVLGKMLTAFNLSGTPSIIPSSPINSLLLFLLHSPATLVVKDLQNNIVGSTDSTGKAVFIVNPTGNVYQVEITGNADGDFGIEAVMTTGGTSPFSQEINSKIKSGETKNFLFNYTGGIDSSFINLPVDLFASYKFHIQKSGNKKALSSFKIVEKLLQSLKLSPLKPPVVAVIRGEYSNLFGIVRQEKSPSAHHSLLLAANDLFNILIDLDKQFGPDPIKSQAENRLDLAQNSFDKFKLKKNLNSTDLLNLSTADEYLGLSRSYFSNQNPYQSFLLSSAVVVLMK